MIVNDYGIFVHTFDIQCLYKSLLTVAHVQVQE